MALGRITRIAGATTISAVAIGWGAFSASVAAPGAQQVYEAVPAPAVEPTTPVGPEEVPSSGDRWVNTTSIPVGQSPEENPYAKYHFDPKEQLIDVTKLKPEVNHEDTNVENKPKTVRKVDVKKVNAPRGKLLAMPVNAPVTSRFGMRFHPVLRVWKLHRGTDFGASCGTPVGAAAPGRVIHAGWAPAYGIRVVIDHGKIAGHHVETAYNHLSALGVRVGQHVDTGDGVGLVGTTGYSTGCHLDFEVKADGQYTDGLLWLNGKPIVVNMKDVQKPPQTPAPHTPGTPGPQTPAPQTPTPTSTPTPTRSPQSPSPTPSPTRTPQSPTPQTPTPTPTPTPDPDQPSTPVETSPDSPSPTAEHPSAEPSPDKPGPSPTEGTAPPRGEPTASQG